eukprot:TRINITY_DN70134_c0_g1_i1.p1 TRINITY_DN70134_c0_g1~~TRINITY_DN70134_c0_g1_i1.p1  ORF type:complete len:556 (+),score=153.66 TRINITY_DN70134_c0_g1_i1:72-1739(+)
MAAGDVVLAAAAWLGLRRLSPGLAQQLVRAAVCGALLWAVRRALRAVRLRRVRGAARRCGFRVAVVGGGFSGVCAGAKLAEMGIPYTLFERSRKGLGGTWRENLYPGCECDVQSVLYSFSFAPNADWSRLWSPQAEILRYLRSVADRFGVTRNTRLGSDVLKAEWHEGDRQWCLTVRDTESGAVEAMRFSAVIAAPGQLNTPIPPRFPGMDRFRGRAMHTAQWDTGADLRGKRVACVGSGASAIQVVPAIAPTVGKLDVYQRSPSYLLDKGNTENSALWKFINRHFSFLNKLCRFIQWIRGDLVFLISFMNSDPLGLRALMRKDVLAGMRKAAGGDEELLAKLTPDFPIGCKRLLLTSEWAQTLREPHVDLITDPIKEANEKGLVTADGKQHEYDVIVLATGFDSQRFVLPMEVVGSGGTRLSDAWTAPSGNSCPRAYLGITVPDYPNFFLMYGPSTNLGTNSIIFMIECQMQHVCSALATVLLRNKSACEVRHEAAEDYYKEIAERAEQTVFGDPGCNSWYKNKDGVVVNNWIATCTEYWWRTHSVDASKYRIF